MQQYLFFKLRIEPTSKVKVEYNGSKLEHSFLTSLGIFGFN